jgi:hypothetical protein
MLPSQFMTTHFPVAITFWFQFGRQSLGMFDFFCICFQRVLQCCQLQHEGLIFPETSL